MPAFVGVAPNTSGVLARRYGSWGQAVVWVLLASSLILVATDAGSLGDIRACSSFAVAGSWYLVMLFDPHVWPSASGTNSAGTTATGVGQSAHHASNERSGWLSPSMAAVYSSPGS